MKNLPLFYFPGKWLWVDDDQILLNVMTQIFSTESYVQPFNSPKICLDFLKDYRSPLSQLSFLKSNKDDESYGILQHTPVDFDVTMIANLVNNPVRHDEITVMVIDYSMPEMDGFTLAKAIQMFFIQKILLTGKAETSQAIDAFNNNLIHRFVQKGAADMVDQLTEYLKELSLDHFRKITSPLLSYLETESRLPLSDPIFVQFFEDYCKQRQVKEYYLIDKQGSFLCIDLQNNHFCLIVQSDRGISSWLTLHGNEKHLPDDDLNEIQNKKKIPFFGVGKEAWQFDPAEWQKYFYNPSVLEGREHYYWVEVGITASCAESVGKRKNISN